MIRRGEVIIIGDDLTVAMEMQNGGQLRAGGMIAGCDRHTRPYWDGQFFTPRGQRATGVGPRKENARIDVRMIQ
jgi:hypothetical protein